ncbi:DUF881 domain-containing protein [Solibacillus sp. FSL H8-0538]|uniref:DUF881 domain-containing protein n=1 Tax=Solibacillus sp. FSL H8-0538 TaxID=2921400 RepID=UPI0030F6ECBE
MTKKMYRNITIVSFIIGFMLAVQYNTVQNPTERDTRDIWEIRQELADEKKRHSELLTTIRSLTEVVNKYEDAEFDNPELLLEQTVEELRIQAGVVPVNGPGLTLTVSPSYELVQFGYDIESLSPILLIRLINDLYRYNAETIEIDGQRLTHTSAIRDINGQTSINSVPINNTDIEIKVMTQTFEQAQKMYNHLLASSFRDEFFIDNLNLAIHEAQRTLNIQSIEEVDLNEYLTEKN